LLRRCLPRALALSRIPGLLARLAERPPREEDLPDRPKAAVAVIFAPDPDSVLLIRRAEREGDRWSGQIALPGGRWSAGDPDLAATARRETLEEVGVDLAGVPVAAVLDDLAPRTPVLPPIVVRPFVFSIPRPAPLSPNPEVAGAWWMPLETLLTPELLRPIEYQRHGALIRGAGYHLDVGVLWGMTERILTPVLDLLR
jgi:8-oxo-dGTP pyrophosphatase MutT (NUDIX family)